MTAQPAGKSLAYGMRRGKQGPADPSHFLAYEIRAAKVMDLVTLFLCNTFGLVPAGTAPADTSHF